MDNIPPKPAKLASKNERILPESADAVRRKLDELGITDADIKDALAQARQAR